MSKLLLLLLSLMVMMTPMAMDIYLPGLEHVTNDLHTTFGTAQLTISLFMLGFAASQLLFGSLSDHYGRRKIFFMGISLFILASLACILAPNIETLIVARFLQAAGGCVGTITAFAVVRDQFSKEKSAKLFAVLGANMAIAPILAPIIGAHLLDYFSWRSTFVFVLVVALIIYIMSIKILPETTVKKTYSYKLSEQIHRYLDLLKHPVFITYALIICLVFSGFFAYIANSPDFLIRDLNVSIKNYSYLFACIGLSLIIGNFTSGRIISFFGMRKVIYFAVMINAFASLLMLVLYFGMGYTLWTLMIPVFFIGLSYATLIPAALGCLLAPFHDRAGMATALVTSLRFGIAPIFATVIAYLHDFGLLPYIILLLILSALAILMARRQVEV